MNNIPFFTSYVSPHAKKYVNEVLRSRMLSEGEVTRRFEKELEKHFHLPENSVVCTNSGTSALHLALRTLGVRLYDEVILPAQTFIATGLAVLYADATPVFCDIGYDGNIDPDCVKRKTTFDTKAVIAVNWAGKACDLERLQALAKEQGLKLIVDAAQSLGVGMGGDITCLSFQATKHLTTGDGGAVICYNPDDYVRARKLSWFGIDRKNDLPDILGERIYNIDYGNMGFKYHMNNVAAAIGLANLETFDKRMEHRKKIADIYYDEIDGDIADMPWHRDEDSAFWHYPISVTDLTGFSLYCKSVGVPVSNIHRGIDHNNVFGGADSKLINQRAWEKQVTHLPIHHEITEEIALWICERINEYRG